MDQGVEKYNKASELKQMANVAAAETIFMEIIASSGDNNLIAGAFFHTGEIAFNKKHYGDAIEKFEMCLKINPNHRKSSTYIKYIKDFIKKHKNSKLEMCKRLNKKRFLLHDPLIIGHHLVYAENFIDWALERGFMVIFSGFDVINTPLYFKYSTGENAENVEFIPFDLPGDKINRFFTDEGCLLQVNHIRQLQKKFKPEITFFQYGDYMWPEWDRMLKEKISFFAPTYMLLIRSNEAFYLGGKTFYSEALERQIGEGKLFKGIITLDEYQVKPGFPKHNFHYLPDPFTILNNNKKSFTSEERKMLDRINDFLDQTKGKTIILFIGVIIKRKNLDWLLEVADKYPECCYMQLGKRLWEKKNRKRSIEIISRLKKADRYLAIEEFIPFSVLSELLISSRIKFILLPYQNHYGSSGIKLMALKYLKPVVVPDDGLMGRRAKDNGLGLVFEKGNQEDFNKKVDIIVRQDPNFYADNINRFMKKFSQKSFFSSLDNIFNTQ